MNGIIFIFFSDTEEKNISVLINAWLHVNVVELNHAFNEPR